MIRAARREAAGAGKSLAYSTAIKRQTNRRSRSSLSMCPFPLSNLYRGGGVPLAVALAGRRVAARVVSSTRETTNEQQHRTRKDNFAAQARSLEWRRACRLSFFRR